MADAERVRVFGATVAKNRLVAGYSQLTLATEVGSTQSTISAWERGESEPPPDMVFELERAFKMVKGELSHLLGYVPVGLEQATDTEEAIAHDLTLTSYTRELLLGIYKTLQHQGDE